MKSMKIKGNPDYISFGAYVPALEYNLQERCVEILSKEKMCQNAIKGKGVEILSKEKMYRNAIKGKAKGYGRNE